MINLLPDERKRQIRAGHTNVTLVGYIVIIIIAIVFLAAISIGSYISLMQSNNNAKVLLALSNSKTDVYSSAQAQSAALTASLATARTILGEQVSYTKLLTGIAAILPTGTILDSLSLTPTSIGTPITLQAYAKTTQEGLTLKQQLQNSPLFSNVSLVSLANSSAASADGYPVSVSFTVTINKGAAQ